MARASQVLGDAHRLDRFDKLLSDVYWTKVNASGIAQADVAAIDIEHHDAGAARLPWLTVSALPQTAWKAVAVGASVIGPSWTTHWFRLTAQIPPAWNCTPVCLEW